jgi:hypothetical protein
MQEQENTKERDLKPNSAKAGWKRILNYQSIVKQVPFFLFLAFLAVIYIYNGHYADKTYPEHKSNCQRSKGVAIRI